MITKKFWIIWIILLTTVAATPNNEVWFAAATSCSTKNSGVAVGNLGSLVNENTGTGKAFITCNIPLEAESDVIESLQVFVDKQSSTTEDLVCTVFGSAFEHYYGPSSGNDYVDVESWNETISGSNYSSSPMDLNIICPSCSTSTAKLAGASGGNQSLDFSDSDYGAFIILDNPLNARLKCKLPNSNGNPVTLYGFSVRYQ